MKRKSYIVGELWLPHGLVVYVSKSDWVWANQFNWCLTCGYPSRRCNKQLLYLHHCIADRASIIATPLIDHIDGNKLNNRRGNLRGATSQQNQANRKFRNKNCRNNFPKGVGHNGYSYTAHITVNRNLIWLGSFSSIDDAAIAYANAARFYFGSHAGGIP